MRHLALLLLFLGGARSSPGDEASDAYRAGPFAFLSQDYFARFSRDPAAAAAAGEMAAASDWEIVVGADADPLTSLMAGHLAEFLSQRMDLVLPIREVGPGDATPVKAIVFSDCGSGNAAAPGSFSITVAADKVTLSGSNPAGLRDGVVHLVDRMGMRAAPILEIGSATCTPRLSTRVGAVPWMGSYRDVVFHGNNSVIVTPEPGTREYAAARLLELSASRAIPELVEFQRPALRAQLAESARQARRYGLKTFLPIRMWDFYPADSPLFTNHPGLRGAEAYYFQDQPPAGYLLCTEDPLMRQFLMESIRGIFEAIPLDGVLIIIGGEEFQHCFMRPAGAEFGHSNCARCEPLGPDAVVSNLCNYLAEAARASNPEGLVVAWPYSAKTYWSSDAEQSGLIAKLGPGTALLTEIEKDETVVKESGVTKAIWDYSIDFIGPTERAQRQIAACKARGIPVFLKSEPELAFEAPGLPYIPCMDRWADRAEALAGSGADGAWVFPWFQACHGTTSAEVFKFSWWNPAPGKEAVLMALARRIAGREAAPHLRKAWAHISEAVSWSPEQPPYFSGPYYLGPAHPLFADPAAALPACFLREGRPSTHVLKDARGDVEIFGRFYRKMEAALQRAVEELDAALPLVPERCRAVFLAEALPARWFYHTARTHANFYESAELRDFLNAFAAREARDGVESAEAQARYDRWRAVLADERENTAAAIPVVEEDPRLDVRNGMGKTLAPAVVMMRAKLELLEGELNVYLPALAARCGLKP